ncbi:MAG: DNA repair protein RecO C-terminal domain-containing protein [Gammaproteobacteria bacterium]|nr:DNA repair protein RecO C-terminal domain-containing protein [Gammaproteobacteria bacterium]
MLTQIDSDVLTVPAEYLPSVFYINELLLYLLPKHAEQHKLFQHYQKLLLELSLPEFQLEPVLRNFEIELLSELGYMPDLSFNMTANQIIDAGQRYFYDGMSGIQTASANANNSFSTDELLAIKKRQFNSAEELRAAKRLMRQIIDFNLQGRELQSRKFYQQMHKK